MERKGSGLSDQQKRLKKLFYSQSPSWYLPGLITIFGYQLGILLSQLAYWDGKGKDNTGWIYKTAKDLQKETGLTIAQQKYAIRHGKELGVLEMTYRQVPRKRHYKADWEKLAEIVEHDAESHGLKVSKTLMHMGENKSTITKNTHKTTSKRTPSKNSLGDILKNRYPKLSIHREKDEK